jgi:hypothetical protein
VIVLLVMVPSFGLIGAATGVAACALFQEVVYLGVTFQRTGLRARDLAANVWRPALATGGMALALLATGLTQQPVDASGVCSGLLLAATVLTGALVFGAIVLLAWLASGRPRGAETYLWSVVEQAIRHWRGARLRTP